MPRSRCHIPHPARFVVDPVRIGLTATSISKRFGGSRRWREVDFIRGRRNSCAKVKTAAGKSTC